MLSAKKSNTQVNKVYLCPAGDVIMCGGGVEVKAYIHSSLSGFLLHGWGEMRCGDINRYGRTYWCGMCSKCEEFAKGYEEVYRRYE